MMSNARESRPVEQNKVFISSVMRVAVEDLLSERTAVHEIVCSYDFLTPWAFERAPASSEDLERSYLRPVEECDIFILIIGSEVTDPVIEESIRAKELDKHVLVFVKKVARQSQAVRLLLTQLDKKYASFTSTDELKRHVKEAIDQISSLSLRSPRTKTASTSILHQLLPFVGTGTHFRVTPVVPRSASGDSFLVRDANPQTVTLYKTGPQEEISVPTSRVREILDTGADAPRVLVLDGRLQHVTSKWRWHFFEDRPDPNSDNGFARNSNLRDPVALELMERLKGRCEFYWGAVDEVPVYMQKGWVVCYDDEGRFFFIRDPVRDLILVTRRKQAP
jgi:hypothetical protein